MRIRRPAGVSCGCSLFIVWFVLCLRIAPSRGFLTNLTSTPPPLPPAPPPPPSPPLPPLCCCTVVLTYLRFGSAHGCLTSLTSILVHSCTACCGCLTSLTSILVQSCTAWRGCLASLTSTLVHNCTARCSIHGAACFTCLALLLPSPSLSQDAAMPPSPIASALHETHPRPKPWRSPSLMSPSPRHTLQERLHQHTHTHIALRTYCLLYLLAPCRIPATLLAQMLS